LRAILNGMGGTFMESEFQFRKWAVVVLGVAAAAILVTIVYQAGVSHGIALQPPAAVAPAAPGAAQAAPPPGYPYYPYRYYGPWRFGFFGPLLAVFFFVFVLRSLFWGLCGWGWRGRRWRYDDYPDYGASRFDEWHRRAHDRMRGDQPPAAPTSV
jgi:hypothetical protein